MFIRTPLAICLLATSLAAAQCLPKTGSKVSDERISTIFGEGDSRGCEARRGNYASLIQNCVSEPNGELLRSSLEGAKQRFCEGSLGTDCEAGNSGDEAGNGNNHGGGLQARRNGGDDEDEDRKDSFGQRNRDRNRDKGRSNDRKAPPLTPSNQPSQNLPGPAPPERQTSSQNLSPPPVATQSPTTLPPLPPQSTSSATIQTSAPTLASYSITSVIVIAQSTISLQTTTTTTSESSRRKGNNKKKDSSDTAIVLNSIINVYHRNWTLFCTDKAKAAIREAEKVLLEKCCYECDPEEIKKDQCDKCMKKEVLKKWEREPADLLGVMERAGNGTTEREGDGEKERRLKFPQKTLESGALGNGGLGRIDTLLGVVLGIGSVVWGI